MVTEQPPPLAARRCTVAQHTPCTSIAPHTQDVEGSGVSPLLYALEDGSSDDSQAEVEGSASSDEDTTDTDDDSTDEEGDVFVAQADSDDDTSSGPSSDDDDTSDDDASDSEGDDSDALALAYVGDDAQGNPQLVAPDGAMFSMVAGEDEDEEGEPQMYLVEQGHLDDAAAASSSSDSGECALPASVC